MPNYNDIELLPISRVLNVIRSDRDIYIYIYGLNTFLHQRKVPGYESPICICGNGLQTPEHLFTNCTDPKSHSLIAMGYTTISEVRAGLSTPEKASKMA